MRIFVTGDTLDDRLLATRKLRLGFLDATLIEVDSAEGLVAPMLGVAPCGAADDPRPGNWTPPETSDFVGRSRGLVNGRLPGDGMTGITLLEDGRRGAEVCAPGGSRPYACTPLPLNHANRFML